MEVEYGVGITNRFAYLCGSGGEEDEEISSVVKKEPKKKVAGAPQQPPKPKKLPVVIKTSKPEEKPAPVSVKTSTVSSENKVNSAKNNQNRQQVPGGEKSAGNSNRAGEVIGDNRKVSKAGAGGDSNEGNLSRPKSGTRVFRNSAGGPPVGRSNNQGRFERDGRDKTDGQKQSSGMKTGAKTNAAAGTANQKGKGPNSDECKDDKENVKEGEENQETNGNEKEGEENQEGTDNQTEEQKSPVPTFTLRQWKSLQAPREKPQFNIRKPGEGEDKLTKLVPMKKNDELKEAESDEFDVDEVYYPQRAGKQKRIEDVGFTTGYQKQRRGGRTDGRGGGRGRSAEGNGRGHSGEGDGRSPNPEKKVDQEQDRMSNANKPRGGRGGFMQGMRRSAPVVQVPKIDDTAAFPTLG